LRVIRVFPRETKATPTDALVRVGVGPTLFDSADEVHISATFSWDLPIVDHLAKEWSAIAPVKVGGPAMGMPGGEFCPGEFLRPGYVITSRGCPNRCWFCDVWRREGPIRELQITNGVNVLDDNLLACSDAHISGVFDMLARVRTSKTRVVFTGGLEAARLKEWHVLRLRDLHPHGIFFAYDTPDDLAPLRRAGEMILGTVYKRGSHCLRAYVLVGYPKDTMESAEKRMRECLAAGFTPMAMLYRDREGKRDPSWARWQRIWARPALIYAAGGF